ncbi:ComEC/Rec2 family competence protein [Clostridium sp. L2-50]|uniref:ComEC/Rec2 family competence protein n=1 Tax=Clostridium sp. L2-50 TaxID=411489 RepID=UPI00238105BD|nr:ComEC/Rec2 family competence protein [Clostridium sp. L2-50]
MRVKPEADEDNVMIKSGQENDHMQGNGEIENDHIKLNTGYKYRRRRIDCVHKWRNTVFVWLIFVFVGIAGYCNMSSLRTQENFAKVAAGASCKVRGIIYDRQETTTGWVIQIRAKKVVINVAEETKVAEEAKVAEETKVAEKTKEIEEVGNQLAYSGQMKIVAYMSTSEKPILGQDVVLSGVAALPEHATNPGGFDAADYYKAKKIFMFLKDTSYVETGVKKSELLNTLQGIKERVASVYDQTFEPKAASVLSAMVLGDKRGLDRDTRNMYQLNGIAHILAISGLHIAILGMTLFEWLRKRTGSYRISGCVAMIVVVFYGIMTGLSGSTSRAVIMMGLVMIGKAKGRSADLLTSAGIASIGMAVWNPYVIRDAGFQLSFAAVAGLAVIHPVYVQTFGKKGKLRQAFGVSLSSSLATLPICVFYYYQFPLYGILLNLLVVPLVSCLLMSALVTAGCGIISIKAAELAGIPAHFILILYERLCGLSEKIPFSSINVGHISVRMVLVYYLGLGVVLFILRCYAGEKNSSQSTDENNSAGEEVNKSMRKSLGRDLTKPVRKKSGRCGRYLYGIILVILLTALYEYANLDRSFVTVFLDVGQGDGILIRTEQGTSILIDGGSTSNQRVGEYVLLPAIRYYGMSELDYVFVTHGDADHISGIEYLLNAEHIGVRIRNLVLAKYGDRQGLANIETLAKEKNINVVYMEAGDKIQEKQNPDMAGLTLECLYPSGSTLEAKQVVEREADSIAEAKQVAEREASGITDDKKIAIGLDNAIIANVPGEEATGSGLNANDLSMVLLAKYDGRKILFTGDAGSMVEKRLILEKSILLSETDALKVGHHGSHSASSKGFLQMTKPQYAIISCGKKNHYGHPHEETLMQLQTIGARVYRTDQCGAIILHIQSGKIMLHGYGG